MINSALFLGYPVELKKVCLIYPPKVKDVVLEPYYHLYVRLLTYSQEEVEDDFVEQKLDLSQLLTPLEYLLNQAYNNLEARKRIEDAFYFFIREPVTFMYESKSILIGDLKEIDSISKIRQLNEDNFFDFQNLIRQANGQKPVEKPNSKEHPRIKAIKAKARYRDKIKAKSGKGLNLNTMLSSICCMGLGINLLNIGELSYAAIPELFDRYQLKEKYDLDVSSLLAGADSKKVKPKYWIKNLDD